MMGTLFQWHLDSLRALFVDCFCFYVKCATSLWEVFCLRKWGFGGRNRTKMVAEVREIVLLLRVSLFCDILYL